MRDSKTSGLQVVTKEEKEPRVKAFIEQHIEKLEGRPDWAPVEFLLVARSPESPVCRALSALAPALAAQKIAVRVVFTAIDTGAFQGDLAASANLLQMATSRIVCDSRLYEAHEQLILDEETCWIGDCMRREPAKRDAYESYTTSSVATAHAAALTFAHLWRAGSATVPISRFMPAIGYKEAQEAGIFSHPHADGENSPPTALTRH
ncbi:MAG: hypothetical protein KJ587_05600 [Alphaproteobacteria bacterium]|nr:hypothetical protein [Alphaproteobacteria bacterium]